MAKVGVKEVTRRYNSMLKKHEEPVAENRFNCYTCKKCGDVTKTIDIDNGTTPMQVMCEWCRGWAMSAFYNDLRPTEKPTVEWYRPTLKQTVDLRKKPFFLDHVLNGGLMHREIKLNEE